MKHNLSQISATARSAVQAKNWATVSSCARTILKQDKKSPEGYFLSGLVEKAAGRAHPAKAAFSKAISLDAGRYDAAIELANQFAILLRYGEAKALLQQYESRLSNSPLYLDMAANIYARLGLHARAWPLYHKANELQPGIDMFQANLAASSVYVGKIREAKAIYTRLLQRHPDHQRNHYQLSRLARATDSSHVEQMQQILEATKLPAEKNVFMYYAIGKELEDLERWAEAFHYYQLAGDAVSRVADYDVGSDIRLIDKIMEVCNTDWLAERMKKAVPAKHGRTPIFIVGLPRTGTTLTERIVSSHSRVESVDETYFIQKLIQQISGVKSSDNMNAAMIGAAAKRDMALLANGYLNAVDYRLGGKPMFIDKFPENHLYLGFIAKAFPSGKMIHLRRNPMDSCFAMYKQSFFKYAYTLESLGRYYVAYDRLRKHWGEVLKNRLIDVEYESLVVDQEGQTRILLDRLGLDFEPACLNFDQNRTPSATASSVQVREKVHTRSVNKWKHFEKPLQPLKDHLDQAGISVD